MSILLCLLIQAAQTDDVVISATRYAKPQVECSISWKDGKGVVTRRTKTDDKVTEWQGTFQKKEIDALVKVLTDAKALDLKAARCSKSCGRNAEKHFPSHAELDVRGKKGSLDTCPADETKDNKPALAVIDALFAFAEKHATEEVKK